MLAILFLAFAFLSSCLVLVQLNRADATANRKAIIRMRMDELADGNYIRNHVEYAWRFVRI